MRMKHFFSLLLAFAWLSSPLRAQTAAPAKPRIEAGFATDRLARLDQVLQRYVDENQIAGAVALVMRDGRVVYERALGWADKQSGKRMTTDAIFRIASQTKALTSTAILMLVEEGKFWLDDPVSEYIPQFAHTTVATRSDTGRVITAAKRAITIRDLLTHTAGISYGTDSLVAPLYRAKGLGPAAGWGWYTADKNEPICTTMERLATLPFVSQPGEAFVYGYNTDILGCIVERVSGVALDEFIRTRITQPLGMKDTFFFIPLEKRQRLTTVYLSDSSGHAQRAPNGPRGQGDYVDGPRRSFAGGAGLLSTARDYARFLQMLLNGGAIDGVRILAPKTIDLMTTNQVGSLFLGGKGRGFGLGFGTTDRVGGYGFSSVGSWGWGGAYGSTYMVDPKEHLIMVFMIQQLPNSTDVASKFQTLVYQALVGETTPMPPACATTPTETGDTQLVAASGLVWNDFPRPGFDAGMKLAVLHGDPSKSGSYTLRLQLPAGYRFPLHWHPSPENLTVVSGTFLLGMGNTADSNALKTYSPGDYIYIPPRHSHFGGSGADGPTIIQLHGQGPFQTILGAPK